MNLKPCRVLLALVAGSFLLLTQFSYAQQQGTTPPTPKEQVVNVLVNIGLSQWKLPQLIQDKKDLEVCLALGGFVALNEQVVQPIVRQNSSSFTQDQIKSLEGVVDQIEVTSGFCIEELSQKNPLAVPRGDYSKLGDAILDLWERANTLFSELSI